MKHDTDPFMRSGGRILAFYRSILLLVVCSANLRERLGQYHYPKFVHGASAVITSLPAIPYFN
ncbi:MAG TPA: hypothetical protein VNR87_08540 [Flavisolibacter sp.]|nr:hypothetical protein [Flavisolibacter sp.]